ncbi:hypothetical protein BBJK_01857 [Bifidobacterium bifidum LMG 13195]|uniref:Uncharacterized protein n=1 Tax=Bifidobacterium bifidum LMG 13195 TaxID=1207542 RepID=A0A286TEB2_BIFBI|nr:hypothetical protein BBJK_01857 [Bifidobacterium bifidum LMG 13195]
MAGLESVMRRGAHRNLVIAIRPCSAGVSSLARNRSRYGAQY